MDRPDPSRPTISEHQDRIMVGRTQSIEDAQRLAEDYRMKGFQTWIEERGSGSVRIYEVFASKPPQGPVIRA